MLLSSDESGQYIIVGDLITHDMEKRDHDVIRFIQPKSADVTLFERYMDVDG